MSRVGMKKAGALQAGQALEGDADHLVVLDHRAAAVAGIDRRVGLHGEEGAVADVHVVLHVDARDDAARVGNLLAAGGEAVGDHLRAHFGQRAEGEGLHALGEIGIVDLEHGEVDVVPDEFDVREIFLGVMVLAHDQFLRPGDNVRVGHDPVAVDEKAGAGGGMNDVENPRRGPVRFLVAVIDDLDDRLFRLGAFRQRRALRRAGQGRRRGHGGWRDQGTRNAGRGGRRGCGKSGRGCTRGRLGVGCTRGGCRGGIERGQTRSDHRGDWSMTEPGVRRGRRGRCGAKGDRRQEKGRPRGQAVKMNHDGLTEAYPKNASRRNSRACLKQLLPNPRKRFL